MEFKTQASSNKPTKEQRAMEYYKHAAEFTDYYWKASKADEGLEPSSKDLQQASAKLLLLGHALELTLKGWLILKEGLPVKSSGSAGAKSLKSYGHDLKKLADATVQYYPPLKQYLGPEVATSDENGNVVATGVIEHLNSSYWAGGARAYEYPEGDDELQGDEVLAFLTPLDNFALFVNACRHELLNAIMAENGGQVPSQFKKPLASATNALTAVPDGIDEET